MRKILSIFTVLILLLIVVACGTNTFTVTFNSNEGTDVAAIEVEEGETFTAPTAPTKTGFTFDGWYKESALTNVWNFSSDVVNSDITLYAKWTPVGLTDQQKVDAAHSALTLADLTNLTNSSPRIILPASGANGVTISWAIDKLEFIAANGVITQPTFEEGDQTVNLTATISSGSVSRTKVFTATVKALPSLDETEPVIDETFDYTLGNILEQTTPWGPVSGKSGNSVFTVVDTITGMSIPKDSNALKIEAYLELQIEAPVVHAYDLIVFEVDLMQTTSSNGSAINIQSSSSSPVVAFGLDGASLFYRTDNGTLIKTGINVNQWYTLRAEVNITNKTLEVFYYEDGQLISMTPGPVAYTGTTAMQSLFIRSGSSNTTALRDPAYVTNIIANRIEALPRPVEEIKLGDVEGIQSTVSVEEDGTFSPDTPTIHNYFGSQRELVLTTEYTLVVNNPVDTSVPALYTVTYTFTNVSDPLDIKVVTQEVTVYAVGQPNEITGATSTTVGYLETHSDLTVTVVQPQGTLYYLLSHNATETAAAIMLGTSVTITEVTVLINDLNVGESTHIHFVVSLNGESNVWSHALSFEAVTMITTPAEFYAMASVETNLSYALANDLDFTGFTWATTNASFKGRLYGDGFTIKNLTMASTAQYGGIFSRANGAIIRDLVLENINVVSSARGGALIGRVENVAVLIENVVLINSFVQGADSNGVGGLIGHAANQVTLNNVAVIDTEVTNVGQKNVGGVIGRVGGGSANTLFATDVFVKNVTVNAQVSGTDLGAGAFVGYVTDNAASIVNGNRIVIVDSTINSVMGGALIGYLRHPGTAVITNTYAEVSFAGLDITHAGLIARVNEVSSYLDQTTIFGSFTGAVRNAQTQDLANTAVPTNQAWWTTNLPTFVGNDLWTFGTNGVFELAIYLENSKPMVSVTLDYNFDIPNEVIEIRQDNVFSHGAPLVPGYNFVGFYTDAELLTALPVGYVITIPVTLYGKYEVVPASTVSFVTNVAEVTVPSQAVNYGELATVPVVADQMIEGVLKEVTGWTLNGAPFSFTTEITTNIELVAVWEAKEYQVTFDGANAVTVLYGELVVEPTEVPTHYFAEVIFSGWQLSGSTYDFNTPVTTNINLVSAFADPVGDISISTVEQFHYMATVESTYSYVLTNNLDFTTYTWVDTGAAFKGSFNGQNYTISNLSIQATNGYGGIFARANGATIQNLHIDNLDVFTTARAGGLVGRVENGDTTIENIVIKNSSIEGNDSNGVGGLIGLVSRSTMVFNVAIIDTTVTNTSQKNVGGLVGRVDSAPMIADDIFISGVTVSSANTGTSDVAASAVVGYIRDNVNSIFSGVRIVVLDTTVSGNAGGAFVGYNRFPGTADLMDAYFEVTFIGARTGLIGYNRDQVVVLDQSSIFGSFTNATTHSQVLNLTNTAIPTDLAWWETNLNAFVLSDFWTVGTDGSITLAYATA
ncbi:MAG: InlB B-repeat-containing protein [Firmicutes bacterium]|nr:InlB B-repeat-containing protein [Bacillota bacterium]